MTQTVSASSKTSLKQELQIQKFWQLKSQLNGMETFNSLLHNEFLSSEEHNKRQQESLRQLIRFCSRKVPYYKQLFREMGLSRSDFNTLEDLQKIPLLSRTKVQKFSTELCATKLPPGEKIRIVSKTSGTTGQPVVIRDTGASASMFAVLKQREYRWFGWNPRLIMAAIKSAKDLPLKSDGEPIKLGETSYQPYWSNVPTIFETGPFYGFMWTNAVEAQKEWLARINPAYLVSQSADLEHLALAYGGDKIPSGLKGILAISQDLTEDMEERIKNTFKVPVNVNYGLNEVGVVASRCPEGGRYHVHTENCYLEIVDDSGKLCRPGQKGRIVVTALNNLAMPLIRYDTDDLAEVVEGPCPCGRTLPAFGKIHGRYRRLAALPPGTMNFLSAVIAAIEDIPEDAIKDLRQYRLHQFRDGSFELSVVASSPMGPVFREKVMAEWSKVESAEDHQLNISEVDSIPRPTEGKFQKFTSDFMPIENFNVQKKKNSEQQMIF
jgi:phenylacetate-CoA ligase